MPRRGNPTMWGVFAVIALLIVGAFMFYNSGGHGPGTVSSNTTQGQGTTR
jgi:ABC-type transporter Mla subunit MlaD